MNDQNKLRLERFVVFDSRVFRITTVQKAAYRLMQSFTTDISTSEHEIRCVLRFISGVGEGGCERLVDEFKKEVLDQELREQLKGETETVRNLILAHAFSRTGLVANEQVSED